MLDYDELENDLQDRIEKIAKKFNQNINRLIKEFAVDGGLEVNRDLSILNKRILKELKESGIEKLYDYMVSITAKIEKQNISYYSKLSSIESDIRKSDSVKYVAENLKKNLIGQGLQTVLTENISNTIKPYVLSNSDYNSTSTILEKILPKEIKRYATQITKGLFSVYDGAIQNTIKQKYNPKKGKYLNSLVESSRPFCIHMRETYGNKEITVEQLQKSLDEYCPKGIPSDKFIEIDGRKLRKGAGMLEGTTVQNFDINKGGATNNCNHTWVWIIE